MKYTTIFFLLLFMRCSSTSSTEEKFEGKFSGSQNGVKTSVNFSVKNKQLNGTLILGEQSSKVEGSIVGTESTGIVHDNETGKEYNYKASLAGNELQFSITFPELNNQVVSLPMQREGAGSSSSQPLDKKKSVSNSKERDSRLIGVWRNTEVLSSGTGDSFGSLSTEYFIEFRQDGTALSWTGRSAGMGSSSSGNADSPDRGEWYSKDNTIYFIDPATKEEASTNFSADDSRLLLSNEGSQKKIYHRVE